MKQQQWLGTRKWTQLHYAGCWVLLVYCVLQAFIYIPYIIVSTSCRNTDARAQVAVALGYSLTRLGRSVLLIDGDMRNRYLSRLIPDDAALTLGDAIAGDADLRQVVRMHPTFGFDMISAAQPIKNPADLLSQSGFSKLMDQATATYDDIIIDTAPVLSGPSTEIILHKADFVLLTLREGRTLPQDFTRAQSKIRAIKSAPCGTVVISS